MLPIGGIHHIAVLNLLLACAFACCPCQVDRGCNVLEFHEKPPRTQLATMSIDTLEYGFGEGRSYACSAAAYTQP
jgi:hypothetical protein